MGIFSRKKAESDEALAENDGAVEEIDEEADEFDDADSDDADGVDADEPDDEPEDDTRTRLPRPHDLDRSNGPYDRSEIEEIEDRLDLGALILAPVPGSELRLDVDESGQTITGVTAVIGDAALQVQAFAAPRSSGVWDDIRDEIADNLIAAGGTADEKLGELGIELHARMPAKGPDGRTTYSPVRFVGVDGPRWFLRGVLSGQAAVDDAAAEQLLGFMREAIVVRGGDARAPRELLELTIPADLMEQAAPQHEPVEGDEAATSVDDLKPFERGPEITEVR